MTRIGIRELRQRASEYLRRVEAGETLEVTDRGRPVALLSPIPAADPLDQLRAAGEVSEPVGDLDDLPEPLDIPSGQPTPSAALAQLRSDER
jgi:prevent-host-death family protein